MERMIVVEIYSKYASENIIELFESRHLAEKSVEFSYHTSDIEPRFVNDSIVIGSGEVVGTISASHIHSEITHL